ncbi:MAG TPA: DUF4188 domain-containing protein [Casimicrobiaceae bacterium]|jgi:hypothetical protein|nr:DUF4188 domain-containing protein [Casimicrobiaceae bacterium]
MTRICAERMTARIDGEIVVFLIGMRINRFWKVHKWLPVARAMPRMIAELAAAPEHGFLGAEQWLGNPTIMLQYWRSFEALERYAKNRSAQHLPAWAAFNRAVGSGGDVGIWHETYRVRPGDYECIYNNMPLFGLARAAAAVPASGRFESAEGRMREVRADRAVSP